MSRCRHGVPFQFRRVEPSANSGWDVSTRLTGCRDAESRVFKAFLSPERVLLMVREEARLLSAISQSFLCLGVLIALRPMAAEVD